MSPARFEELEIVNVTCPIFKTALFIHLFPVLVLKIKSARSYAHLYTSTSSKYQKWACCPASVPV